MAYQTIGVGLGGQPVQVFRPDPVLPAHLMKTYEMRFPTRTHFREASCVEVECDWYHKGQVVGFDLSVPAKVEAAQQFGTLCKQLGLTFTVNQVGTTVQFTFQPGQRCPRPHRVPLGRDPLYIVRGGDWRGNPRGTQIRHRNAADFTDDWQTSQAQVFDKIQEG
jgi:hypothetical protein